MATKRKTKAKRGRPSNGLSEVALLVKGPALLFSAVEERARAEGISRAEAWRRAARVWLGWSEVVP